MGKAKTVKIKAKESQLRGFCSFFVKMQRKMVFDMEQGRWVLNTNGTISVEPEFYNTLCEISELLSAKVAEHGHAPRNAVTMDAVETDLTLNEEGLDAVADFLKSVAEEKPVPKTLEER